MPYYTTILGVARHVSWANPSYILPRKTVYDFCPISPYVSKRPSAAFATAAFDVGWPLCESLKTNCPFWLLVAPGVVLLTSIWSKLFSPDHCHRKPNFNVWLPSTFVRLSERLTIGPPECDGYG